MRTICFPVWHRSFRRGRKPNTTTNLRACKVQMRRRERPILSWFVTLLDPPPVFAVTHPQPVLRVQLNISELPSSFDDCPLSFLPFIFPLSRPPLPSSHSKVSEELLNF